MKMKKIIALLLVVAIMAVMLCSCAAKDNKKFVMATNAEFAPFEFHQTSGAGVVGDFDGIDILIAKAIADDMGKELQVDDMEFDAIIPAVKSGKADIGIAGMTVKPDRLENVDFSTPYYTAVQTILVKNDNTDIKGIDSLVGKKVGVVTGYTGDVTVTEYKDGAIKDISRYQKGVDAVTDLLNGKVDAVVIDSAPANQFISKNDGKIKGVQDDYFEKEEYAIAVQKGNTELLEKINKVIEKLKAEGKIDAFAAEVDARL